MSIDSGSGQIQWTPTNEQVGGNAVTVRVEDAATAYDTQSFNVTVANVNDAPTITSTPVTSATEGETYSYDVEASDPDVGATLTFFLEVFPSGMSHQLHHGHNRMDTDERTNWSEFGHGSRPRQWRAMGRAGIRDYGQPGRVDQVLRRGRLG